MLQKIETEVNIPEGYEFVRVGLPVIGDYFISGTSRGVNIANIDFETTITIVVKKVTPRRKVFECISEVPRYAFQGEYYEDDYGLHAVITSATAYEYKIWKEVLPN